MEIRKLDLCFSVCKVNDYSQVNMDAAYIFIGKTEEENSLICPSDLVPKNIMEREDGWTAFCIQGVLDFSLIGILNGILTVLAQNRIGILAVSTYNTDYILVKQENDKKAIEALKKAGYKIIG